MRREGREAARIPRGRTKASAGRRAGGVLRESGVICVETSGDGGRLTADSGGLPSDGLFRQQLFCCLHIKALH